MTSSQYVDPVVITTWRFTKPTDAAWEILSSESVSQGNTVFGTALDAVVEGCTVAEDDRSIKTVGYGGSPDEEGHTTLDAMVMDGKTMEVGAVAGLPQIRRATQVAREVLHSTYHTLLVGEKAAEFAKSRGFSAEPMETPDSQELWQRWRANNCQPNYRKSGAWDPDPATSGGPYKPVFKSYHQTQPREGNLIDEDHHDTIGMIALDRYGSMAVGVSTSGAVHKIPGRVGDSPIPGAGGYVDNDVGGAVGTGDGDVMMRFLLTFQVVQYMRQGLNPTEACVKSLQSVKHALPWSGALVALNISGEYGAACVGTEKFHINLRTNTSGDKTQVIHIPPSSFSK